MRRLVPAIRFCNSARDERGLQNPMSVRKGKSRCISGQCAGWGIEACDVFQGLSPERPRTTLQSL
jgi:hypothetical protein